MPGEVALINARIEGLFLLLATVYRYIASMARMATREAAAMGPVASQLGARSLARLARLPANPGSILAAD